MSFLLTGRISSSIFCKAGLPATLLLGLDKPGNVFSSPSFMIVLLDIGLWVDFFFFCCCEYVLPLVSLLRSEPSPHCCSVNETSLSLAVFISFLKMF